MYKNQQVNIELKDKYKIIILIKTKSIIYLSKILIV